MKKTQLVVVHPLLPANWGESVSVALGGFAASFSRQSSGKAATPEGSLHKSRADSVMRICGQLRDVVWYVRECDKGGRVVMGMLRRRFSVDMIGGKGIYLFLVGL